MICFQLCGDRDNPSVSVSDAAYCIPANPMSDRGQAVCIALEGNGSRPSHQGGGYSEDGRMFTLNTIEKHAVCYGISSYCSNAMLSDNPRSGFYEAKTSRCLDLNGGNPSCNQGGVAVVVYEGQNACTDTKSAFTLQSGRPDDHHIPTVCYGKKNINRTHKEK